MSNRDAIVAIINRKGGAGKSTTTFQLAGSLVELGQRVLIVDLDPQASLTRLVLDEPVGQGEGIGNCLLLDGPPAVSRIRPTALGFHLLPGDRSIEGANIALLDYPGRFRRLRRTLAGLNGYDVVLVDTPPSLDFATASAMVAARWAILPTGTVQQDIDALVDTLALLDNLAADDEDVARRLAIIPTGTERDNVDRQVVEALHVAFGDLVMEAIPRTVAVKRSMNARVPVCVSEPRSPAVPRYRALAELVVRAVSGGIGGEVAHATA